MTWIPETAKEKNIDCLIELFCTEGKKFLKKHVCNEDSHKLPEYFNGKIIRNLIWTINKGDIPIGMIILELGMLSCKPEEIAYLITNSNYRRQGIGSTLVEHAKTLPNITSLRAEALNEESEELFKECGFKYAGCGKRGKIFAWNKLE